MAEYPVVHPTTSSNNNTTGVYPSDLVVDGSGNQYGTSIAGGVNSSLATLVLQD
jgi:hypothetical protein